ncbi:MAG: glycerophosphodiester phosphodiesterase family protein [Verrucomicrobiaceae bacterium]|nr:glycerophosphodiester phosphodiesterase family protein [Verrucomicrobiaceae bacterium]
MSKHPLIIAHRGASAEAPENTLVAFLLAFMQGADAVEADVRMTSDGHLVVVHDEDTKRVSGVSLKVSKTSLEKLRGLDVGRVKTKKGQGQRMPRLEEVLAMMPEEKLLLLHLKIGPEGVVRLIELLKAAGELINRVRLMSAEVEVLMAMKQALPECGLILLCERRWTQKSDVWLPEIEVMMTVALAMGAEVVAIDSRSLAAEPEMVNVMMERGVKTHVWTVNRAPSARRFSDLGVSGIKTDYPGHLVSSFAKAALA